mgnify:CR=1 FL=1
MTNRRSKVTDAPQRKSVLPRRTQLGRTEATTAALLAHGQRLFTKHGYAVVAVEDIAAAAGATRGALYHHFKNKKDVFNAVFQQLQSEVAQKIDDATATAPDRWEDFRRGTRAFLEACLDPSVQRIMIVEAPTVLGIDAWREADAQHSMRQLREGVADLIAAGELKPVDPDALVHLINGALNDAARWIASSDTASDALTQATNAFELMIAGLRRT